MAPQVGQTVIYVVTQTEKDEMKANQSVCNQVDKLPAVVTQVWSDECVNLKVTHDGTLPDFWVTSSNKGTGEREWDFMPEKE